MFVNIFTVVKGERSLKYETTKPVSSKKDRIKSATGRLEGAQQNNLSKPPEKKIYLKGSFSNLAKGEQTEKSNNREKEKRQNSHRSSSRIAADAELEHDYREMKIRIKKPESVVRFEEDLLSMNNMEHDFMRATKALQKKLGIDADGMI